MKLANNSCCRMEMQKERSFQIININGGRHKLQVWQRNPQASKRKVKTWTAQEDSLLKELYDAMPKKWMEIAAKMEDRNQNQCLHRFRRLNVLGSNHKIWSAEEDQKILKLVEKHGKNWKVIAEKIKTKNGKQIRERFINKLDPTIIESQWSIEEDLKIVEMYSRLGSRWSQISKSLSGRPENKIKNRYYSFIRKNYEVKLKSNEIIPIIVISSRNSIEHKITQEQSFCALPSINEIENESRHPFSRIDLMESNVKIEEGWKNNHSFNRIELHSNQCLFRMTH